MPRYIDTDIAVAQIIRLKDNDSSKYDLGLDTAINEIKHHIPTADVVEVVRCKDCAYKQDYFTNGMVKCGCGNGAFPEDFFCADGERSDDD